MEPEHAALLKKQGYALVGRHSAVKLCHWMRQKLFYGRPCYKEAFYGIQTHRCLQMTPAVYSCTQMCVFCWRNQQFTKQGIEKPEEPEKIVEESIMAQRKLISGFKGDGRCNLGLWKDAQHPNQVAISLAGEPTLYPYLGDLIECFKNRGFTTFLVTNGTVPEALEALDCLPTQLYVTVAAPSEEVYRNACLPLRKENWTKLQETLKFFPSFNCRKVVRHTLVRNWNLGWAKDYAKLDMLAEPDFIEAKAFVFVGGSRNRLNIDCMPSHSEILEFAAELGKETGYELIGEKGDSRVALLSGGRVHPKIQNL
ncbi:MAG: 4-demethylwyosine synthase TYW1 [Thermoplasmata archaeon]|nr:4-demethylwyosine synthase TYW1 [Thermoplasmata archaeon]